MTPIEAADAVERAARFLHANDHMNDTNWPDSKILDALAKALREGTQAWCLETDVERMYIDPPDRVSYTPVLVIELPDTEQEGKEG